VLAGCGYNLISFDHPAGPQPEDIIGTWIHDDGGSETTMTVSPDGSLEFTGLPLGAVMGPLPKVDDPWDSQRVDGDGTWDDWTVRNDSRGGYPTIDVTLRSDPLMPGTGTTLQLTSGGVFFYTYVEPELRFEFERSE
jgi:hypothetical protein